MTTLIQDELQLHRDRLLSPSEIESRMDQAYLSEPDVAVDLATGVLAADPYNFRAHKLLAQLHARAANAAAATFHLGVCFDLRHVIPDYLRIDPKWQGELSDEDFSSILDDVVAKQASRVRDTKDLSFDEVAPTVTLWGGFLVWPDRHQTAMEEVYRRLLRHADSMEAVVLNAPLDDDEESARLDRLQSPFPLDEAIVGPFCALGKVMEALQGFSPYVDDVRLVMRTQSGPVDEIWIVGGVFYCFRHATQDGDWGDGLASLTSLAEACPDDVSLRLYLQERIGDRIAMRLDSAEEGREVDLADVEDDLRLLGALGEPRSDFVARLHELVGDPEAAVAAWRRAIATWPQQHIWRRRLAACLLESEQYSECVDVIENMPSFDDDDDDLRLIHAMSLELSKRPQRAAPLYEVHCDRLLARDPRLLKADADILHARGLRDSARVLYTSLLGDDVVIPQKSMTDCAKKLHEMDALQRPSSIPPNALWRPGPALWAQARQNDRGNDEGEVRYWRPNGTYLSSTTKRDGKVHGRATRFHDNGELACEATYDNGQLHGVSRWFACDERSSEPTFANGHSKSIHTHEVTYDRGRATQFRFFLADGDEVTASGVPVPKRPHGVPENAVFSTKQQHWAVGGWDANGKRDGVMRFFREDGSLDATETFVGDVPNGPLSRFRVDGTLIDRVTFIGDKRSGPAVLFHSNGEVARRGVLEGSRWVGPVESFDRNGTLVDVRTVQAPEPPSALPLTADERRHLDALGEKDLETRPREGGGATWLSPTAMAHLFGIGWGGGSRNLERAQRARRAMKEVANRDPALFTALRVSGLDRAPKIRTEDRLERLWTSLVDVGAVDRQSLHFAFSSELQDGRGGVAGSLIAPVAAQLELLERDRRGGKVDLQSRGLRVLPAALAHMPLVEELDASYNVIVEVGDEISEVAWLHNLNLSFNRISTIAPSFRRLHFLSRLALGSNALTRFPSALEGIVELRSLDMERNQVTAVPEWIEHAVHLEELRLDHNPIRDLPKAFGRLPSLRVLSLDGLEWSTPPPCLWELQTLETLSLTSPHLERVPESISQLTNLKKLVVWNSQLRSLPTALFEMTHLSEIRISNNPLLPSTEIERLKAALPECRFI